ncbi:MAG: MBL fold metallo-hydrolase [Limnospira sp. PMC 1291.21]|uniref:Beta-lactamase domain protein n=2 Tax=Limnospira TaxID=2596745 RepID=B5VZN4_LIMMA|nr:MULTISPECIES: MBL fold metallo-hydrolase [Limnospira]EKD08843.1 beta-lactamase domain protein [Arthrospira platensis C1]MDC0838471.1 MBL fold metallo-hydrolase [Limnoraphis robusta]MDY7053770.1 MBL fold metallo-hydrolase [Limnospira fusiformis LS22]QJB29271.1 MBL fold metallo-hydrolase [Limnospira fusiformis SAG 85.79]EDZ95259.1 beta-lactamase domain protein [Limnospira maxima CS-328]
MKLIFLGSGSAFTVGADNFQSNMMLVAENNRKLLIDCGSDLRHSLYQLGWSYRDVTDIYISHIHADHTGGLEYMGFTTKFDPNCSRPKLYLSQELVDLVWNNCLAGSMTSIEDDLATLETYFDIEPISPGSGFTWEGVDFTLVPTIHIQDKYQDVPSYGLSFSVGGVEVFLTTDTKYCPQKLQGFYESANLIFHDCNTAPVTGGVHAHYQELITLPDKIKNKIWLYHYPPGSLPNPQQDGFQGFIKRGQTFVFEDGKFLVEMPTK